MKEALTLALEALERVSTVDDECDIFAPPLSNAVVEAITAIKEALAQPKRTWVGVTHKEMYDAVRPLCSDDEMAEWLLEESEDEYLAIEAKLKEKNYG